MTSDSDIHAKKVAADLISDWRALVSINLNRDQEDRLAQLFIERVGPLMRACAVSMEKTRNLQTRLELTERELVIARDSTFLSSVRAKVR